MDKLMICAKAKECKHHSLGYTHCTPHKQDISCAELCHGVTCIPYQEESPKQNTIPTSSSDHRIHIKGHTAIKDGVKGRVIDAIEGMLAYKDLPDEYKAQRPACWYPDSSFNSLEISIRDYLTYFPTGTGIKPGDFLPEDTYRQWIDLIHQCGDNLHRINQAARDKAKEEPFEEVI